MNLPPPPSQNTQLQQPSSWATGNAISRLEDSYSQEQERRNELRRAGVFGSGPFRFFLGKGETANILILDPSFNTIAVSEHNLRGADGKFGKIEPCISSFANCPICDQFGAGYLVVMLTILDLRPYEKKNEHGQPTGEIVPYTRKLLPIKLGSLKQWRTQVENPAIESFGDTRGIMLKLCRENTDKSAATGMPVPISGVQMMWKYSEADIIANWAHPAITSRDGAILLPANGNLVPYDYPLLFPAPDKADIVRRYGAAAGLGGSGFVSEFQPSAPPPRAATATQGSRQQPASSHATPPVGYAPPSTMQQAPSAPVTVAPPTPPVIALPPAQLPLLVMTPLAQGTYADYVQAGWSDEQLVDTGFAKPNPALLTPSLPPPPPIAAPLPPVVTQAAAPAPGVNFRARLTAPATPTPTVQPTPTNAPPDSDLPFGS